MEIKFRGKNLDGEWSYGQYSDIPEMRNAMIFTPSEDGMHETREVKRETVGQYINHKDINGIEIYVGDIVDTGPEPWEGKYEIVWDDKELKFGMLCQNGSISSLSFWINNPHRQLKVVGNKFDNPELQTKSNQ